jgi:O-antigen ligase
VSREKANENKAGAVIATSKQIKLTLVKRLWLARRRERSLANATYKRRQIFRIALNYIQPY